MAEFPPEVNFPCPPVLKAFLNQLRAARMATRPIQGLGTTVFETEGGIAINAQVAAMAAPVEGILSSGNSIGGLGVGATIELYNASPDIHISRIDLSLDAGALSGDIGTGLYPNHSSTTPISFDGIGTGVSLAVGAPFSGTCSVNVDHPGIVDLHIATYSGPSYALSYTIYGWLR